MPEGSHSALHQGLMGEESPRLCSPLSANDHDRTSVDLGTDCYSRLCVEPLDRDGERPVSLVSTLSSGSSRDSHSLFGSTAALPSSTTPPIPSEEDIDLELSPTEGAGEQAGEQSPTLGSSRGQWQEQLEPCGVSSQRNNNNATASSRKPSVGISHTATSPVAIDAMAPNPKLTYVDRVVMEIIETERTYVRDLRSIVEDYLAHIIDMGSLPIRPEQVCALFGNIEDIYEFNSELLQSLDMCENDPVAVARCFVDKSEYFEIYTQYCTNYPNSVAALTDCMRSKTLAKFFRERQASLKRSLPLGSYLLKPVQRILKYHLLLQEIAKHFDQEEEGYEVVQEAIDTMTGVAWYINDMKRKHEHAVRVQEIQSLLINWKGPDLTTYGELVLEGTFHVQRAKNTRTLFLFDKVLLITKKRGEHYVYKTHISCSTLMLLDSAKDPLLFSVIHFKHPKQPHTVQAKSVEEKRLWAHNIKRLILENHHTIVPQKAKEAMLEMDSIYPGKYRYSPERPKKAESCQAEDFPLGRRHGRRRSEPAKQIMRSTKAVLKHADSEGALLGDMCSLHSAASVSTLASSVGEPQAERPCMEEDVSPRRDSLEQPSPTGSDPALGSSPSEGGLELEKAEKAKEEEEGESYKEDILMGDDQDEQDRNGDGNAAEQQTILSEEVETFSQVEEPSEVPAEEALATQVSMEEMPHPNFAPKTESNPKLEGNYSQCPESPVVFPSHPQEGDTPELEDISSRGTGEDEEGESDSSGLQVEETSVLTNSEFSEEEEEVFSDNKSILPPSVLDQAGVIAERFVSSLSRRSSLVSEDLHSLDCSSSPLGSEISNNPFLCINFEEKTQVLTSSSLEPQLTPGANQSPPAHEPAPHPLMEVERRSTLSKQDRLLIHKIRRYYENAEHQDANFSIKRRESLSYIPAGLVRHLSRQLNSIPQDQAAPIHRRGTSHNRPTSWSVFDLPGLEKNQRMEPSHKFEPQKTVEGKARSESVSDKSSTNEEFRPSSDMLKVWQDMEMEVNNSIEEKQEIWQIQEERLHDSSSQVTQETENSIDTSNLKSREEPLCILEETKISTVSEGSPISTPTTITTKEGGSGKDSWLSKTPKSQDKSRARASLPKIISLRSSMDDDQILQDMGKMKNKVFQLARQYSQRIKSNRPVVRPRNRGSENQQGSKNMPAVHEEKTQWREKGKTNLTLPLNTHDHMIIHELRSPVPAQTPSSGASSEVTSPNTLLATSPVQTDTFHWPDVQELRSKYARSRLEPGASHHTKVARSCSVPERMLECCTDTSSSSLWKPISFSTNCSDSSDPHRALMDSPDAQPRTVYQDRSSQVKDWFQPQHQPPLCRWSSLDHMLVTRPLHEVQNLQEPVRSCYIASQPALPSEHKVVIVERVPGARPREHELTTRENSKLQDKGSLLREGLDCAKKSVVLSSGKKTESNLVKNLREKFQSLSSSS
ncbi:pleckstrin homology domain-containing family G member 3 isoform X2 [Myripristis murdjan]|uniref:pleckstrin homology domain-containing family G member 3 isoform X2 n=1 Tax=Myripristis murdjan TaxID=586833 RepID=UPI001175E887|nr:pleckstrin homology domain-containing family G member 3-like isoform X2 [Myripristis murdjan]